VSNILWVEDFGGGDVIATVDDVLGGIIKTENLPNEKRKLRKILKDKGITLQINFQDAASFIKESINTIDFVILDIDLDSHAKGKDVTKDCPETISILKKHYNLSDTGDEVKLMDALSDLQKHAGFHLYVDLVFNHQYPRDKILFCSNHGENLVTIQNAFKAAMMEMPKIHTKSDQKVKKLVRKGSKSRYAILRRGVIDGCNAIKQHLENKHFIPTGENQREGKGLGALKGLQESFQEQNKAIPFNRYIDRSKNVSIQDMQNYVKILAELLPLQEPNQAEKFNKYKLFVRTLSHEWERDIKWREIGSDKELRAFVSIMKNTRNWVMHSNTFDHLVEADLAFLFICNMRAMYDLGSEIEPYESKLFELFEPVNISKRILTDTMIKKYHWLSKKNPGSFYSIISFDEMLKKYQRGDGNRPVSDLIRGLYQLFWFKTSPGEVRKSKERKELTYSFNINSGYFRKQATDSFFSEFSSRIYSKSFQ